MSRENVQVVRSIYAAWERGDFSSAEWAHAEIEFSSDWPDGGRWTGLSGMAEAFGGWLGAWEEFRLVADEYRELDAERVLVLDHFSGRGRTSGVDLGRVQAEGAWLFHLGDGKVTRMVRYVDRDHALADVGLTPESDERE
jgi:ketosteroid isomerase-like protein